MRRNHGHQGSNFMIQMIFDEEETSMQRAMSKVKREPREVCRSDQLRDGCDM